MENVYGLRTFLLSLLSLLAKGEKVSCEWVENNVQTGLAGRLYSRYRSDFETMHAQELNSIDEYYRTHWIACLEGCEGDYGVEPENGLQILIALILDELPL